MTFTEEFREKLLTSAREFPELRIFINVQYHQYLQMAYIRQYIHIKVEGVSV